MNRLEFAFLAGQPDSKLRKLCHNFGISPTTGYKWIKRGEAGDLMRRSRRPRYNPYRAS